MTTDREKKVKALFIFPPTWSTFSISTGIPQIMGYLIQNGYEDVEALDLNIKFYQYFCEKSRLKELIDYVDKKRKLLYKELFYGKTSNLTDRNIKKSIFLTYDTYLKKLQNKKSIKNTIRNINKYKIKQRNKISIKTLNLHSQKIIEINELISVATSGYLAIPFKELISNDYIWIYEILTKFYEPIINKIIENNYTYIGFSTNHQEQTASAIFISKMLRKAGFKGYINFGGTDLEENKEILKNNPSFFRNITNSIMLGAGEKPTKELFEYITEKRKIEDITNIIYLNNEGEIVENNIKNQYITEFITPSYNGYDLKEYTLPEIVLPIRTSTGCYWGKCTFCDYNTLTKYKSRTVDDVINEIKTIINKYNVNNFYFVDAALSPKFLDEFSKKIIEQGIKIYYFTNLRFEDIYTKEFLQRVYNSGLRCAGWGLESASPRILKLMNKGTNIETIQRILIDAHEIGILNHLYLINAFPTEKKEDFDETISFIYKNKNLINSIAEHYFHLIKHSYIYEHQSEYNLDEERIKKIEKIKQGIKSFSLKDIGIKLDFKYYDEETRKIKEYINKNNLFIDSTFDTLLLSSKYLSLEKEKKTFWSKLFK